MSRHDEESSVERVVSRRRALAGLTAGVAFGLAGCSGGDSSGTDDNDPTEADDDSEASSPQDDGSTGGGEMTTTTETAEPMETETPSDGGDGKTLTVSVGGTQTDAYDSLVVSIDSLTFRTGDDRTNPAFQVGESVDLVQATTQDPETVLEGITVPYGTYDELAMSVTVQNQSDVSGGTLTTGLSPMSDEPIEIEESQFDATLDLFISARLDQLEITGFTAVGL